MSSILDPVDIKHASIQREELKASWDASFKKNCDKFTDALASNIAKRLLDQFRDQIRDPYRRKVNFENKFKKQIFFNLADDKSLAILTEFKGDDNNLPPFSEWLSKFSEKAPIYDLDTEYFEARMAKVTKIVSEKIQEILTDYTLARENRDLKFKVSYQTTEKPEFSKASSFAANKILFDLWIDEPAPPLESEPSSGLIERYKISRFCSSNLKKTVLAVFFVAILMELIYLRFNSQLTFEGRMLLV